MPKLASCLQIADSSERALSFGTPQDAIGSQRAVPAAATRAGRLFDVGNGEGQADLIMLARLSQALAKGASRSARGLGHLPPTPRHDGKGDHEKHDSDDGRHDGKRTGNVARVRPDEADNRPHDEHGDHRR